MWAVRQDISSFFYGMPHKPSMYGGACRVLRGCVWTTTSLYLWRTDGDSAYMLIQSSGAIGQIRDEKWGNTDELIFRGERMSRSATGGRNFSDTRLRDGWFQTTPSEGTYCFV